MKLYLSGKNIFPMRKYTFYLKRDQQYSFFISSGINDWKFMSSLVKSLGLLMQKKKKKECKSRLYKNIARKIILFKEMVYVDPFNLSLEIFLAA